MLLSVASPRIIGDRAMGYSTEEQCVSADYPCHLATKGLQPSMGEHGTEWQLLVFSLVPTGLKLQNTVAPDHTYSTDPSTHKW